MYNKKIVCMLLVLCALLLPGCANTEALDALIQTPVAAEESYTPNSYAEYAAALEAANVVLGERFPVQMSVDAATENLQLGLDGLLLRADKTELEATLTEAKGTDLSLYLPVSTKRLVAAIESADAVMEDLNIRDKEVSEAVSSLKEAMGELTPKPDKSELEELFSTTSTIDTSLYLSSSQRKLRGYLDDAASVLADEHATLQDVQRATYNLSKAIEELVLKPDKTPLEDLIVKAGEYQEIKYTTASYDALLEGIERAQAVLDNAEATQEKVDAAIADLQGCINSLKKCTKYVWEIEVDLDRLETNHVGNDWSYGIFYNGESVWGSFEVTKPLGSSITIKGKAVENDKIPDSGSGTLSLKLTDGNEKSITFSVRENRGRYSGNRAIWELTASCTIIDRV